MSRSFFVIDARTRPVSILGGGYEACEVVECLPYILKHRQSNARVPTVEELCDMDNHRGSFLCEVGPVEIHCQ